MTADDAEVTVTGLVEDVTGSYLSGWAIDPARAVPCEIVVVDADDAVVARGLADRRRSDLALYGFGQDAFGFRLAVASLGASPSLRVYADGAELSGSPVAAGPGRFDGVVAVIDGHAEGWVHERLAEFAAPEVTLFDRDGLCLGHGASVREVADPLFSPARFRIRLDPIAYRRPELTLRAEAAGVTFARTQAPLTVVGALDRCDAGTGEAGVCTGWIACDEAPSLPLEIELRLDDVLVDHTTASLPRRR